MPARAAPPLARSFLITSTVLAAPRLRLASPSQEDIRMVGIFDDVVSDLFTTYSARLRFRERVVGGTPSNPKLIEGWLRAKMGVSQEDEVRNLTLQTLRDLGLEGELFDGEDVRFETLAAASETIAQKSNTTMFKRGPDGLYIESRAVKAMLKEATAILYPGSKGKDVEATATVKIHKWGQTGKAPRSAAAEWIFVNPDRIGLGITEPSGIDLSIGHINGPQGPRSTLDYYEYVERPTIDFEVMVLQDRVPAERWPEIWRYAQEMGLGAKRSQGFGRFDVLAWERATTAVSS
jgi:hypothetical protein